MTISNEHKRADIIQKIQLAQSQGRELLASMKQRQQQGWEVAKNSAEILKKQFGVKRVVLFGSMLNLEDLSPHSDIDLAVWGLPPNAIFKAGAAIEKGHEFTIDLVEAEKAKPYIRQAIVMGVEL
ncbi:nucleotidyltransferase domain-containing protein [Crocosphaera sp.]|uniref:nucleotidyltransferase family protein n=1 Tax=Crocosphaera sp. TaxID=2729996 RepID=UPI002634A218|nr:nucleotidyltransferase domain-containing protein [Crocosphaera sp.]MDJ0578867.1 nucleotidyltransferase domain-containing protein [Crocosphaera sp.]